MTGDGTEATWSVAELHEAVNGLLGQAFGSTVWVSGELRSLHRSSAGHSYFELVEPDSDGKQGSPRLSVTLFKGNRQRVNAQLKSHGGGVSIEEGTIVRIGGELRTYAAQSRLQLLMREIDPSFTLGVAQQRRDITMAALLADDLLDANAALAIAHPPLEIGVVTSRGSAAEADVLHELTSAGIGFRIRTIDARTQGAEAESTLVAALRTADDLGLDVILLVRGGGSRSDLAVFDSERLGRTIAALATPLLTGIGHETDRSVADEVAHAAHKTPTAAASAVVHQVRMARSELADAAEAVSVAGNARRSRADTLLSNATRTAAIACRGHLAREDRGLQDRLARVASGAPLSLDRIASTLESPVERIPRGVRNGVERAGVRLEHLADLIAARDPAHLLASGWSITRTTEGDLVTSPDGLADGSTLVTTVAGGSISSVVESHDNGERIPE